MKYYSETERNSKIAELQAELEGLKAEAAKAAQLAEAKKAEELAATKKALAKKVEDAQAKLDAAYESYKNAQEACKEVINTADEKVKAIYDKCNAECEGLLNPAKKKIEDLQKAKFEAVQEFNSKYGPYITSLTGEKAQKEFDKWNDYFKEFEAKNSWVTDFFKNFF